MTFVSFRGVGVGDWLLFAGYECIRGGCSRGIDAEHLGSDVLSIKALPPDVNPIMEYIFK